MNAMNTLLQKGLLTVVGLTVASGVAAGVTPGAPADTKPAAPAVVLADKPDKGKPDKGKTDQGKPDKGKLIPSGTQGKQSRIDLSDERKANAKAIIAATKKTGMDERAAVVAIATSLQESKLENLGHLGERNDHDSQGLFQQRPSSGWGTVDQITDPEYATTAFLKGLKGVDGWKDMPLTDAAQAVQVSAYPFHYAQWETQAADIVADNWNS